MVGTWYAERGQAGWPRPSTAPGLPSTALALPWYHRDVLCYTCAGWVARRGAAGRTRAARRGTRRREKAARVRWNTTHSYTLSISFSLPPSRALSLCRSLALTLARFLSLACRRAPPRARPPARCHRCHRCCCCCCCCRHCASHRLRVGAPSARCWCQSTTILQNHTSKRRRLRSESPGLCGIGVLVSR